MDINTLFGTKFDYLDSVFFEEVGAHTGDALESSSGKEGDVRGVVSRLKQSEDIESEPEYFDYNIILKTSQGMYEYNKNKEKQ